MVVEPCASNLAQRGRKYTIDNIAKAEQSLQDAVESEIYSDHGLEIVSIQVSIDLESLEKTAEMGALQDQVALEKMKAAVAMVQLERSQKKQQLAVEFYAPMIEKGQWQLLAMNLADNKMDSNEALNFLNEQQRKKLEIEIDRYNRQFDLREKVVDYALHKGDGLTEATAENVIENVVKDMNGEQIKSIPDKSETSES